MVKKRYGGGSVRKMKPGMLRGSSHMKGGIVLEAEGGEYIMSKAATKAIGADKLSKANKERKLPKARYGGYVGGKVKKRKSSYKKGGSAGRAIRTYSSGGYVEGK